MKEKVKFLNCIVLSILILSFIKNLDIIFINMLVPEAYEEGISVFYLTQNLFSSISFGILIGSAIYTVFISQDSVKKKIVNYICNLLLASIVMTIYIVSFGNIEEQYTWIKCILQVFYYMVVLLIPYLPIIAITNLVNYIYQRIMIKKLNVELKKEDVKKLNKRILITIISVIVLITVLVIIGLIAFNSATIIE